MNDEVSADLREEVRSRYAAAARAVLEPQAGVAASCCGSSAAGLRAAAPSATAAEAVGGFSEGLYREGETDGLPEEAVLASLGCGNPLAVADLRDGERVLDLGSGGGIDVLLSARRVGPSGFAYGVDMTDDMLELARAQRRQGRRGQRGVPQGRDRGPAAAGRVGGRGDIQLRDQPVHRQARSARGDVPRAGPGRADRHHRRGRRGPHVGRRTRSRRLVRRLHRRRPVPRPSTSTGSPRRGSRTRRSPSPTRQPPACIQRSSGPSSPPPYNQ